MTIKDEEVEMMTFIPIDLNGTLLKVKHVAFKKSTEQDPETFHDCYITFMDDETERYDAQDVTVLKEGEYEESEFVS